MGKMNIKEWNGAGMILDDMDFEFNRVFGALSREGKGE
jgi:hypothetical protein